VKINLFVSLFEQIHDDQSEHHHYDQLLETLIVIQVHLNVILFVHLFDEEYLNQYILDPL
jgi:hypothetical protein